MSKVDAQRAMREAKYARDRASGPSRREVAAAAAGTTATPVTPTAPAPTTRAARAAEPAAPAAGESCGHKSMNGRSCTREAGHAEKSHRYS